MKKFILFCLSLLLIPALEALPLGNPADPLLYPFGIIMGCEDPCACGPIWHIRAGYYGDFVYDRKLSVNRPAFRRGVIRKTTLRTNAAHLTLNFYDTVDLYATLGQTQLSLYANEQSFGALAPFQGILSTNTHFSWSIGARAVLLTWRCFTIGLEGQYFQTCTRLNDYFDSNGGTLSYFNENNQRTYTDWQLGGGLAYTIQNWSPSLGLTPYIGIRGGRAKFDTNDFTFVNRSGTTITFRDMSSHLLWGYAAGATLNFCDCIGFTVEGRWGNEKALHVNGQITF